jgi:hypothetical protein
MCGEAFNGNREMFSIFRFEASEKKLMGVKRKLSHNEK